MADFGKLPASVKRNDIKPFKSEIPQAKIDTLKQLVKLSPIAPPTFENLREDGQYGVTRKWLSDCKEYWANEYDWRKVESHFNSYPSFKVPIKARDGDTYDIHFMAMFSNRKDAKNLCLLHGWPGSVFEFLPYLDVVREKYPTPDDLPWNIVVPSLPGYCYSGGPSTKIEWTNEDMAFCMNEVMVGLGLTGYISHGGDIGSFISRILAVRYDECRAMNRKFLIRVCETELTSTFVNFYLMPVEPKGVDPKDVTESETKQLKRLEEFGTYGNAYAKEHGTKGGTIGLVLSASPLALLAWIGEKFQAWTDVTPSDKDIIDSVTLYWLTDTFPRCIYPYIDFFGRGDKSTVFHENPEYYCKKPMGFSYFPMELGPIPIAWAKKSGDDLIWHKSHTSGGHFAAMEKPKELVEDMEAFIKVLDGGGSKTVTTGR